MSTPPPRPAGESQAENESLFPTDGRLLGIDFGTKRVGLAVTTPEQSIASPIENYTRQNEAKDADFLLNVVDEYRIVGIVVGLPVHLSGDESQKSSEARTFGEWVGRVTSRPVTWWDERFTSAVAEEHLLAAGLTSKQRKARMDMLSAQIMLQAYLDAHDRDAAPQPM